VEWRRNDGGGRNKIETASSHQATFLHLYSYFIVYYIYQSTSSSSSSSQFTVSLILLASFEQALQFIHSSTCSFFVLSLRPSSLLNRVAFSLRLLASSSVLLICMRARKTFKHSQSESFNLHCHRLFPEFGWNKLVPS